MFSFAVILHHFHFNDRPFWLFYGTESTAWLFNSAISPILYFHILCSGVMCLASKSFSVEFDHGSPSSLQKSPLLYYISLENFKQHTFLSSGFVQNL